MITPNRDARQDNQHGGLLYDFYPQTHDGDWDTYYDVKITDIYYGYDYYWLFDDRSLGYTISRVRVRAKHIGASSEPGVIIHVTDALGTSYNDLADPVGILPGEEFDGWMELYTPKTMGSSDLCVFYEVDDISGYEANVRVYEHGYERSNAFRGSTLVVI